MEWILSSGSEVARSSANDLRIAADLNEFRNHAASRRFPESMRAVRNVNEKALLS